MQGGVARFSQAASLLEPDLENSRASTKPRLTGRHIDRARPYALGLRGCRRLTQFSELIPQFLELFAAGLHDARILGENHVFEIFLGSAARPVEAAVDEGLFVEDGELVMHVAGAVVGPNEDALSPHPHDVAATV